jgi:GNAT superfamily N-acetyltransferase
MIDDYLNFFDNVAFTDHPDWSQCYCMAFHWKREWDDEPERNFREWAIDLINGGVAQGYLAYSDSKVVGWCNANDKSNYAALKHNVNPDLLTDNDDAKIKSVVCFLVAPKLRGKGIATKLLERVCTDAAVNGYDFIEGYPPSSECDMYIAHHGTVALFEKCGFDVYKQIKNDCIVRKYLREN